MGCTFEQAMELRLRASGTEAAREVLELAREMYVGDAMALVIESMPKHKTRQLRRWNDDWEAWCEWVDLHDRGWEINEVTPGIVGVLAPRSFGQEDARPSDGVVAAALDVSRVKFLGINHFAGSRGLPGTQMQFMYRIR